MRSRSLTLLTIAAEAFLTEMLSLMVRLSSHNLQGLIVATSVTVSPALSLQSQGQNHHRPFPIRLCRCQPATCQHEVGCPSNYSIQRIDICLCGPDPQLFTNKREPTAAECPSIRQSQRHSTQPLPEVGTRYHSLLVASLRSFVLASPRPYPALSGQIQKLYEPLLVRTG